MEKNLIKEVEVIDIVEELEKHTEIATKNDDEVIEFIDRRNFYEVAHNIIKNLT